MSHSLVVKGAGSISGKPQLLRAADRLLKAVKRPNASVDLLRHMNNGSELLATVNGLELYVEDAKAVARADRFSPMLVCVRCGGADLLVPEAGRVGCLKCGADIGDRPNIEALVSWLWVELARQHGGKMWTAWQKASGTKPETTQ